MSITINLIFEPMWLLLFTSCSIYAPSALQHWTWLVTLTRSYTRFHSHANRSIGSEVCLLLVWRKCAHEQKTIPEKLHVQIYDAPYTKIITPKLGNEVSQKRYDAYPDAHTTQQNEANTTNTTTSIAKHIIFIHHQ